MNPLESLIATIAASAQSDFYRTRWEGRGDFKTLPYVSREDFIETPLSNRRYKDETSLVKIVRYADRSFLSEWAFSDIGKEEFGSVTKRPLVYMDNPYEAIEKSMWCYERGMVPLIGEKDAEIAMFAADKYQIDSLITDMIALPKLMPYFTSHGRLQSISVLGAVFDTQALAPYAEYADELRLVLALPETGAFAVAPYASVPRFAALPGCVLEREETLIVTKSSMLVTPIIRYRTGIDSAVYDES